MSIVRDFSILIGGVGLAWFAWNRFSNFKKTKKTNALKTSGVVAIVDSRNVSLLSKLEKLELLTSITEETFMQFKDALDDCSLKEMHIVMHTRGGSLSAAEAICRAILLARDRGVKITCWIKYFGYSAGCMIAAACDEIRMSETALLGPADAQLGSMFASNSINSICETIEFQLANCRERIKPDWYAKYIEATSTRQRQRQWVDEMCERKFFTKEQADSIYDELFSGKYNHDQVIHPSWAKKIGLPIVIDEKMPSFVVETLRFHGI